MSAVSAESGGCEAVRSSTARSVEAVHLAGVKDWWHQYGDLIPKTFDVYVGLETAATRLISYQPELVPGLLQTADYELALIRRVWPDATTDEWHQRVRLKRQRQHIVTRRTQPVSLDVVVGEAALRRVSGGPVVMATQLRHLADMSTRENITLRVLPFRAGFPGGMSMPPFVILDFGMTATGAVAEPPNVFLEGVVGNMYVESATDVAIFTAAYDRISTAAIDAVSSRALLRTIAKEYDCER